MMHNTPVIKRNGITFTLLQTYLAFFSLGDVDASTVTTGPWFPGHIHTPTTHHQ
jgi:xanthine/uracil permease